VKTALADLLVIGASFTPKRDPVHLAAAIRNRAEARKFSPLGGQWGFPSGVALGGEWVQLRWQGGLSGIVSGLMKNSFAACGFRLRNVALYLLGAFVFDVLPFLACCLRSERRVK
jgi:hypothetical protein